MEVHENPPESGGYGRSTPARMFFWTLLASVFGAEKGQGHADQ